MFERYTEEARRIVFFARYEASRFGSREIGTEHLLMGMIRTNEGLVRQWFRSSSVVDAIRNQIEAQSPRLESISTSVDLPLSDQSRCVLAYGAEEAERLGHKDICLGHLLIGLLREEKGLAGSLLGQHGLTVSQIRKGLQQFTYSPPVGSSSAKESALVTEGCRDLTGAALEGTFHPLVGRERELESIIQVLGRRSGNSPALIGESGVGKTAIVEGLAQQIADGRVPAFLADKRILALDPGVLMSPGRTRRQLQQQLAEVIVDIADRSNVILAIDGLFEPATGDREGVGEILRGLLLPALAFGRIQCIATGTPTGYRAAVQKDPSVERRLRAVEVGPPTDKDAVQILFSIKADYEKYHEVVYDDVAIETAVLASVQFMPRRYLPEKALDLIDEAGARIRLRHEKEPSEIAELSERIRSIGQQFKTAVTNHEFAKARSYEDEERIEREKLRLVRQTYKVDDISSKVVTKEHIEELISERAGLAIDAVRERLKKK